MQVEWALRSQHFEPGSRARHCGLGSDGRRAWEVNDVSETHDGIGNARRRMRRDVCNEDIIIGLGSIASHHQFRRRIGVAEHLGRRREALATATPLDF